MVSTVFCPKIGKCENKCFCFRSCFFPPQCVMRVLGGNWIFGRFGMAHYFTGFRYRLCQFQQFSVKCMLSTFQSVSKNSISLLSTNTYLRFKSNVLYSCCECKEECGFPGFSFRRQLSRRWTRYKSPPVWLSVSNCTVNVHFLYIANTSWLFNFL